MFISSYSPLSLIFLVIDFRAVDITSLSSFFNSLFYHPSISLLLLFGTLISCIVIALLLRYYKNDSTDVKQISNLRITSMDNEVLSYIFSYVLPFLSFPAERRILIIGILLLFVCVIYIKSNLIMINPFISLIGYHIFQVEYENMEVMGKADRGTIILISNKDRYNLSRDSQHIKVCRISNDLFILKGE